MEITQGDISQQLVDTSVWSDSDLANHGIPVFDVPFVSVGGGVGSFSMVDTLRIAGITTEQIRVISDLERPSQTYEYLASNSQIRSEHRLRSDSSSVIDCIWGWPGYALREAWSNKNPSTAIQVLVEPVAADYYTPKAGQVYESINREAARISWHQMVATGVVRHVRRRDRGDYFVLFTPPAGTTSSKRMAFRSRYVHMAVGYPGVRFLADLQKYRLDHNDYQRVVNAYEPHDHVYAEMRRRPCTVMVRGAGIVASRVLQRLIDDRDQHGAQTTIVHLFRTYPAGPQGEKATFRRPAKKGWTYQGFNFPKAAWGGQLRDHLESLEGDARRDSLTPSVAQTPRPASTGKSNSSGAKRRGSTCRLGARCSQSYPVPTRARSARLSVAAAGCRPPNTTPTSSSMRPGSKQISKNIGW